MRQRTALFVRCNTLISTATHRNALQRTEKHCNTPVQRKRQLTCGSVRTKQWSSTRRSVASLSVALSRSFLLHLALAHSLSLSLSLPLAPSRSHSPPFALSLSLSHTHTHTHTRALFLSLFLLFSLSRVFSLPCSFSLLRTHLFARSLSFLSASSLSVFVCVSLTQINILKHTAPSAHTATHCNTM